MIRLRNEQTEIVVGWFRRLIKRIVRNRIHVVVCAASATWAWAQLANTPLPITNLVIVSLMMFCIYEWNRLFDMVEDQINSPSRAWHSQNSKAILIYGCILSLVLCLMLVPLTGNPNALGILILVVFLGVLYSTPLSLMPFGKISRLKNIPILKNVTSGIGWSLLVVIYPAVHTAQPLTVKHGVAAALMFGSVWMVELIWDIRDQKGDRAAKVQTIPVLKGIKGAFDWISTLNVITGLGLLTAVVMGWVPEYWLIILTNNLLIYVWLPEEEIMFNRKWSHLLITIQTLLLVLIGVLASHINWLKNI
ncbi:UbiA family prenyltransferase [Halalkalibaculum sp. DA384]|uniref:UbiA family prenyltransferase n=1 Tax=Halalkalibaculum sp. DA384 TaxID=3373606 RepID=UPI003753FA1E